MPDDAAIRSVVQTSAAEEGRVPPQLSFFAHKRHQPDGEISPATSLQWLGAAKELHPAHACPPFGFGWYPAALCDTFPAAAALPKENAASGAEPMRQTRMLRRVTCDSLRMFFSTLRSQHL